MVHQRTAVPEILDPGLWLFVLSCTLAVLFTFDPANAQDDGSSPAAGEQVSVDRPPPGKTTRIAAAEGDIYVINFDPTVAQVSVDEADFVLSFDDGSKVLIERLVELVRSPEPPLFRIDGIDVASEVLITQTAALDFDPYAAAETRFLTSPTARSKFGYAPFPELRRKRLGQ